MAVIFPTFWTAIDKAGLVLLDEEKAELLKEADAATQAGCNQLFSYAENALNSEKGIAHLVVQPLIAQIKHDEPDFVATLETSEASLVTKLETILQAAAARAA